MSKLEYKDLVAFHPGYYVKEMLEYEGMSQDELAKRLQTSGKNVSDLINGKANLSDEMAMNLSIVFGTSVSMWLNLNQKYIEKKLEIEKLMQVDAECDLIKNIDYKFWEKLGVVATVSKRIDKVRELQKYFRIASLEVLQRRDFLVQYNSTTTEGSDDNIMGANAWVQTAINIGAKKEVQCFNKKGLEKILPELRKMTLENFEQVYKKLDELLSNNGVALVLLPNLKNCQVNGAVKWFGKDKVILAMNNCRKYEDVFWFSLFHELGHIMQQRIKVLIVSDNRESFENQELLYRLENEADIFAKNTLIPEQEYRKFVHEKTDFTEEDIIAFSKRIQIHPGMIVGRLEMEKRVSNNSPLNSLRVECFPQ